ncbi:dual specificity tyrosine-phosphorylation-regulated kinase 2-like [Zophobas morio]|uniref:dual specificity tyrosine-phosphorylation-regulated kinase 2-like n=1 Tax=Zophobas morio TaxID=2755281 RepID=UPI003082B2FE
MSIAWSRTQISRVNIRRSELYGENGFDDEDGNYHLYKHDHIGYRYEILEILGKGSFGQVIKAFDHKRLELVALKIIRSKQAFRQQAATECLALLEREGIIHADLKPENVLLLQPEKCRIKVIDFGSSCFATEKVFTYVQSRFYRSPEVILGVAYDTKIDMWSLGCILAELYTGRPIFAGEDEHEQLLCIMQVLGFPPRTLVNEAKKRSFYFDLDGNVILKSNSNGYTRFPGTMSLDSVLDSSDPLFTSFVNRCLAWDAKLRLSAAKALNDPWLLAYSSEFTSAPRPCSSNTAPDPYITPVNYQLQQPSQTFLCWPPSSVYYQHHYHPSYYQIPVQNFKAHYYVTHAANKKALNSDGEERLTSFALTSARVNKDPIVPKSEFKNLSMQRPPAAVEVLHRHHSLTQVEKELTANKSPIIGKTSAKKDPLQEIEQDGFIHVAPYGLS